MKLNELKPPAGSTKRKTRKGRGEAAGKGKTAGRGTKGTGARKNMRPGFEGGQMPLQRRLPKLPGFNSRNRVEYTGVNVSTLDELFSDGDTVTPEALADKGAVRSASTRVKILGDGDIATKLTVQAHAFSKSAEAKLTDAGGTVERITRPERPAK